MRLSIENREIFFAVSKKALPLRSERCELSRIIQRQQYLLGIPLDLPAGHFLCMANKKSRSIQDQIELLKERGLVISDENLAFHHLGHISMPIHKIGFIDGWDDEQIWRL